MRRGCSRPPAPPIFLSSSQGSARFAFQILRLFQIVDRLEMPQVRNAGLALHLLTAFKYRKSPSLVMLSPSSVILSAAKDLFQLTQGKLREESRQFALRVNSARGTRYSGRTNKDDAGEFFAYRGRKAADLENRSAPHLLQLAARRGWQGHSPHGKAEPFRTAGRRSRRSGTIAQNNKSRFFASLRMTGSERFSTNC